MNQQDKELAAKDFRESAEVRRTFPIPVSATDFASELITLGFLAGCDFMVEQASEEKEEAFKYFLDLCLEDHRDFQNGFADARTAFNEQDEDEEPFDIADHAFDKGYSLAKLSTQKEIEELKNDNISGVALGLSHKLDCQVDINEQLKKELKEKDDRIKELEVKIKSIDCYALRDKKLTIAIETLKQLEKFPWKVSSSNAMAREALKQIGEMK